MDDPKTRISAVSWEQHGRYLLTGHAGSGVQAAWLLSGLSYGTWEPGRWCKGKRHKWMTHEAESTDAPTRGALLRSSEEAG